MVYVECIQQYVLSTSSGISLVWTQSMGLPTYCKGTRQPIGDKGTCQPIGDKGPCQPIGDKGTCQPIANGVDTSANSKQGIVRPTGRTGLKLTANKQFRMDQILGTSLCADIS